MVIVVVVEGGVRRVAVVGERQLANIRKREEELCNPRSRTRTHCTHSHMHGRRARASTRTYLAGDAAGAAQQSQVLKHDGGDVGDARVAGVCWLSAVAGVL